MGHLSIQPPVHLVPLYHETRGSHGIVPPSHGWNNLSIPSHCTMRQRDPMGLYHRPMAGTAIPPIHPVPLYHETRGSHGIVPASHGWNNLSIPSHCTMRQVDPMGLYHRPWDCTSVPWLGQPSHLSILSHCTMRQGDPMGLYHHPMAGTAIPPVHPIPLYHVGLVGSHGIVPPSHGWDSHHTCPSCPTVP